MIPNVHESFQSSFHSSGRNDGRDNAGCGPEYAKRVNQLGLGYIVDERVMVDGRRKGLDARCTRQVGNNLFGRGGQACRKARDVGESVPVPPCPGGDNAGVGCEVEVYDGGALFFGEKQELGGGRLGGQEKHAPQTEGAQEGVVQVAHADIAPAGHAGSDGCPGSRRMDLAGLGHGARVALAPGSSPRARLGPGDGSWRGPGHHGWPCVVGAGPAALELELELELDLVLVLELDLELAVRHHAAGCARAGSDSREGGPG